MSSTPTMPSTPTTDSSDFEQSVARLDANVIFWGTQIKTLHQFRRRLFQFVPLGIVASVAAAVSLDDRLWLWGGLAVVSATFGVGMYMYQVRSHEFAYHLDALKQERQRLAQAREK